MCWHITLHAPLRDDGFSRIRVISFVPPLLLLTLLSLPILLSWLSPNFTPVSTGILLLPDEPDDSEVTSFGAVDSPDPPLVEESYSHYLILPRHYYYYRHRHYYRSYLLLPYEPYSGEEYARVAPRRGTTQ